MKLSSTFYMGVLAVAALIPLSLGITPEAIFLSAAVVVGSTLFLDGVPSSRFSAFGQLGEVGEVNVEEEYKRVQGQLKDIGDQLKSHAEKAQKDIELHQGLSKETKAAVDQLLTTQAELKARLDAAEQVLANRPTGTRAAPMTMGRIVAESEEYAANRERIGRAKGSFSVGVQAALTEDPASGGDLVDPMRVPGIIASPERRLTIRDLLNWGRTGSNSIEFVQETGFTNSADVVSENPASGKPESDLVFDLQSAPVATIAHWLQASKQVLADVGMLQSYIDGRLRYGLKLKEELQLLKGSGVGLNINGLYTQATAYSNPGVIVQSETDIDRLRVAMLQVQLAEYMADGIVLNPIDWTQIELTKDTQDRYIFANPNMLHGPTLWGLPVVPTQSMDAGDFLTGGFKLGAQGWDREDAMVTISTEDRDNFIKNMVTILCEERVALTVYRPEAFVKGSFGS